MKVLFLGDINSIHIQKWIKELNSEQIEIKTISISSTEKLKEGAFLKIKVLVLLPLIYLTIFRFKPNFIHAHYATSYGLLGALCPFKPLIISVWGSDIFSFPRKSAIHKLLLKFNLSRAAVIIATSEVLAKETTRYTRKKINVIPFGIDSTKFKQIKKNTNKCPTIGTFKSLKHIYGIDTLIQAFSFAKKEIPDLELRIAGANHNNYKKHLLKLAKELNVDNCIHWHGYIDNSQLPEFINSLNISIFLSREESFGVAALESLFCKTPVIASNAPGYTETLSGTQTTKIIKANDPEQASKIIINLIKSPPNSNQSEHDHQLVMRKYEITSCTRQMARLYQSIH